MIRLSLQLALSSLWKDRQTVFPFVAAGTLVLTMLCLLTNLQHDPALLTLPGSATVADMLLFGQLTIVLFAAVFLFYAHGFTVRFRKKELGVCQVLGLGRGTIALVLIFQMTACMLVSLVLSLLASAILGKLLILVIARLLRQIWTTGFLLSGKAVILTVLWACAVYGLLLFWELLTILPADPVGLLQADKTMQRPPKARWFSAVLGVVLLGWGYWLAVTLENPVAALAHFFLAVLLVMTGTYLLFSSGLQILLHRLEKNRHFYYKTSHMMVISSLKHRLQSSAFSLASICILSTMILVALSSTICLWAGTEQILAARYPRDITIETVQDPESMETALHGLLSPFHPENLSVHQQLQFTARLEGNTLMLAQAGLDSSHMRFVTVWDIADWNRQTGQTLELAPGQILLYDPGRSLPASALQFGEQTYKVKQRLDAFPENSDMKVSMFPVLGIVVASQSTLLDWAQVQKTALGEYASALETVAAFDTRDDPQTVVPAIEQAIADAGYEPMTVDSRTLSRPSAMAFYGSFLFLGLFLSLLFGAACIFTMYYKQISEGLEDRNRFAILQSVGLDESQARSIIRFQVLLVFFLPLGLAGLHLVFAFPMVDKVLQLFAFQDTSLFLLVTLAVFGCFALLYLAAYGLTSRVYWRMVH